MLRGLPPPDDGIPRNLIIDVVPLLDDDDDDDDGNSRRLDLTIAFGPCHTTQEPKFTRYSIDNTTAPLEIGYDCLPSTTDTDTIYIGVRRTRSSCGARCYGHHRYHGKYNITAKWNTLPYSWTPPLEGNCFYSCPDGMLDGSQPEVNRNGGCEIAAAVTEQELATVFAALVLLAGVFLFIYPVVVLATIVSSVFVVAEHSKAASSQCGFLLNSSRRV
jgi:hypothetical protein